MKIRTAIACFALAMMSVAASADRAPVSACDQTTQVEIAQCLSNELAIVNQAVAEALAVASASAIELDKVTERDEVVPALEQAQAYWQAYRNAHCSYAGATYGGGSGAGIAVMACQIQLGRLRVEQLEELSPS